MPAMYFEIITTIAQLLILLFILYYMINLRHKEQELDRKLGKNHALYSHIVDEARVQEKKILDTALEKADQIIADAKTVSSDSKKLLDHTLNTMATDIQTAALTTATEFSQNYQAALKQLSKESIDDFKKIDEELKSELQKQLQEFHDTQLSTLKTEMEEYKQAQYKQAEQGVRKIVQKVSKEFLTNAISLDDHNKLLMQSLEKAKKEGLFDER